MVEILTALTVLVTEATGVVVQVLSNTKQSRNADSSAASGSRTRVLLVSIVYLAAVLSSFSSSSSNFNCEFL